MSILNKTFVSGQTLSAAEMNQIVEAINGIGEDIESIEEEDVSGYAEVTWEEETIIRRKISRLT